MPKLYTVEKDFHNSRLDKWFKIKVINLPQSLIEKIIRTNKIKVNKKKTKEINPVIIARKIINIWK